MNKSKLAHAEPVDLEEISRLIDGKPARDPEAEPDTAPIRVDREKMVIIPETETTVDIDTLDRLRGVSLGAFIGCLVIAILTLAAFIAFPVFLKEVTKTAYWFGMGGEALAVFFTALALWIKNCVIGG